MKKACIIGAGQLGSRHLQALKGVTTPLEITVVDPFEASLNIARERYDAVSTTIGHTAVFTTDIATIGNEFDIVIVPTNSNVRRKVIEELLSRAKVKYLILEKLLFQKREDYDTVEALLEEHGCKAWVNCSMRTMPFYHDMKAMGGSPLIYVVTGSQYGLITNAIHYIDHIAYLTGCYDFELITSGLDPKPIPSKRPGFLELNGTLGARFKDGSFGIFTCFPDGTTPIHVEIHSMRGRCISRENEKKAWVAEAGKNWTWEEVIADIPFQSQMTTRVVETILQTGECALVPYKESVKLHITLLDGLLSFLNTQGEQQFDLYPFT